MSVFIPLDDERIDPSLKVVEVTEVGRRKTFPLQNREPLLDLIHPRAVNGGEMKAKAWMPFEPCLNLLAGVHPQVVADDVDQGDRGWGLTINLDEQDPGCEMDFIPNAPRRAEIDAALCNCLGFGSKNSALVLGRVGS